jgi:myo-inositol-1(or 4)-monophosphatase
LPLGPKDLDLRLRVAEATIREAGQLARRYFADPASLGVRLKGPQDWLTEADGASERLIRERLLAAFPEDTLVGEEGGGAISERTWVVDPIDGTANFARGRPHWGISIAFVEAGVPTLGVVYGPMQDELYAARRGGGAVRNGVPIRASATVEMGRAFVECGYATRIPHGDWVALVGRVLATGAQIRRAGSAVLGLAYVADGRSDGYCELHTYPWDALAGILLVEEAGGRVSDFLAGDGLKRGNPVLACAPGLAPALAAVTGIA